MSNLLVHRVADAHAHAFAVTFRDSVKTLRARASDPMIDHAIDNFGAHGELVQSLAGLVVAKAATDDAEDVYAEIISQVAVQTAPDEILSSLQITSPAVIRRARTLAGNLVTNVSQQSQQAIRDAITRSVMGQLDREETRAIIRGAIGLNARQGKALANFGASLFDQGNSNAFDMIAAYSDRLLDQRAATIARTETMTAANFGQVDAWSAMQAAGFLPDDATQVWLVTDDDRLCDDCAPMGDQAVGIGGTFQQTEKGVLPSDREPYAGPEVDAPPLHENCRCTLVAGNLG